MTKPNINLHFADCIEWVSQQKAGFAHHVITDPPYMIGAASIGNERSKAGSWDDLMNASRFYREWIVQLWERLPETGFLISFLNGRSLPILIKACSDASIPATDLVIWDKVWIGPAGPAQLRKSWEMLLVCAKPKAKVKNRSQADVLKCKWMACHSGKTGHPAEKPVELLEQLLELYTEPGQVIFDGFAGSGSTGVASINKGRRFVGCESNKARFEAACIRLNLPTLSPLPASSASQRLCVSPSP